METTAKLRHLRMSPRKVRLVADAIRGINVEQAFRILPETAVQLPLEYGEQQFLRVVFLNSFACHEKCLFLSFVLRFGWVLKKRLVAQVG